MKAGYINPKHFIRLPMTYNKYYQDIAPKIDITGLAHAGDTFPPCGPGPDAISGHL